MNSADVDGHFLLTGNLDRIRKHFSIDLDSGLYCLAGCLQQEEQMIQAFAPSNHFPGQL